MKYLLDTNICIYVLNRRPAQVIERMVAAGREHIALSSITAAELAFGAAKSTRPSTRTKLEAFLATVPVLDWGGDAVWHYAELRLMLERAGTRIGERDLLIAAHARALQLTLVTNNSAEFARVAGLALENWAIEPI